MPTKGEEVDGLVGKFEVSAGNLEKYKGSAVKLQGAERNLLSIAVSLADVLDKMLPTKLRPVLQATFEGEGIERFHRTRKAMDMTVLSDTHKEHAGWLRLKRVMETIEEVLNGLGMFKPPAKLEKTESIKYSKMPRRFDPGATVSIMPEIEGGAPTKFEMSRGNLPEGLELNPVTGEISGTLRGDMELGNRKYKVIASSQLGSVEVEFEFGVQLEAPRKIAYTAKDLHTGEKVLWAPEVVDGGKPSTWTITPALPPSLVFDTASGIISGTAMKICPSTKFEVTGTNSSGECDTSLEFKVELAAPGALEYPGMANAYPFGTVMLCNPTVRPKGEQAPRKTMKDMVLIASKALQAKHKAALPEQVRQMIMRLEYAVTPELPKGLMLVKDTGVIVGKPAEPTPEAMYTVTAKNASGETSCKIPLAILQKPPENLEFPKCLDTYSVGQAVELNPTIDGFIDSWTVEPALPDGLYLDRDMGIISGVPTTVTEPTTYTVTATNEKGSTSCNIKFEIIRAPPSNLKYPDTTKEPLALNQVMEPIAPSIDGIVDEFKIEPALPPGLEFDPKTGVISGKPTTVEPPKEYTVTATNTTGVCEEKITLSVKNMPPSELCYPRADEIYNVYEAVELEPQFVGTATKEWTIEPALPAGLNFDKNTGKISGIPTEASPDTDYTIVAANEEGGTSTVVSFKVMPPIPPKFSYPTFLEKYIVGKKGDELNCEVVFADETVPVSARFSVSPALPEGVTIDVDTGLISGKVDHEKIELEDEPKPFKYTVTLANMAGTEECEIETTWEKALDDPEVVGYDHITDLDELLSDAVAPDLAKNRMAWMLWMVHRAYLNDPTLETLTFTNMPMPLPHVEPRIAPKLMKALEHNDKIVRLELANTNMQKPEGNAMAEAMRTNSALEFINIESNCLSAENIKNIAVAIRENGTSKDRVGTSKVKEWKFANQRGVNTFGNMVDRELALLADQHWMLKKLGTTIGDADCRNKVDRALMRNNDWLRRAAKAGKSVQEIQQERGRGSVGYMPTIAAKHETYTMRELHFKADKLTKPAFEIFDETDEKQNLCRSYVAEKKMMPTRETLQQFSKNKGVAVSYGQVAGVLKDFNDKLISGVLGTEVMVKGLAPPHTGPLKSCVTKNDRTTVEMMDAAGGFSVTSNSERPFNIHFSDELAEFLKPSEA